MGGGGHLTRPLLAEAHAAGTLDAWSCCLPLTASLPHVPHVLLPLTATCTACTAAGTGRDLHRDPTAAGGPPHSPREALEVCEQPHGAVLGQGKAGRWDVCGWEGGWQQGLPFDAGREEEGRGGGMRDNGRGEGKEGWLIEGRLMEGETRGTG